MLAPFITTLHLPQRPLPPQGVLTIILFLISISERERLRPVSYITECFSGSQSCS